jgi:hypothetical protein
LRQPVRAVIFADCIGQLMPVRRVLRQSEMQRGGDQNNKE